MLTLPYIENLFAHHGAAYYGGPNTRCNARNWPSRPANPKP